MKKKLLAIILITNLFSISSFAQCNFGINLGDKYPKSFKDKFGELELTASLHQFNERADKVCANNTFEDIDLEYTFIYGELGSIELKALNDQNNTVTKKFILMNYAKTTYGEFNTGTNPQAFNYFNIWRKNNSIVLYKRMLGSENVWDESIYITNKEYKDKISAAKAFSEGIMEK